MARARIDIFYKVLTNSYFACCNRRNSLQPAIKLSSSLFQIVVVKFAEL